MQVMCTASKGAGTHSASSLVSYGIKTMWFSRQRCSVSLSNGTTICAICQRITIWRQCTSFKDAAHHC